MSQGDRTAGRKVRAAYAVGRRRKIWRISSRIFYILILLVLLLPFVRDAYGVSYTQLGLVCSASNVISAVFQTPAGFLVDWLGARMAVH